MIPSRSIFFLAFLLVPFTGMSQDTLIKTDQSRILAKVLEISPNEIRYKRFDYLDGPTYVAMKSEFSMIIYASGVKETFAAAPVNVSEKPKVASPEKPAETPDYYGNRSAGSDNRIDMYGSRFRQHGHTVSENEVHKTLMKTMDKEIILKVGKAKDNKKLQYIGFGAIPLGIASLALLTNSIRINPVTGATSSNGAMQAGAAVCFAAAIACPISSGIFKKNRNRYTREAVELYNQRY